MHDGDVAVVHAAAGGVGLLLTQMIKRRGGIVVATTSGGHEGSSWRAAPAPITSPATTASATPWTRPRGRGRARGVQRGRQGHVRRQPRGAAPARDDGALRGVERAGAAFDLQRLNSGGSLFPPGPPWGTTSPTARNCAGAQARYSTWIASGELDVRIGGTYPLADAARAQEDLAAGAPRQAAADAGRVTVTGRAHEGSFGRRAVLPTGGPRGPRPSNDGSFG